MADFLPNRARDMDTLHKHGNNHPLSRSRSPHGGAAVSGQRPGTGQSTLALPAPGCLSALSEAFIPRSDVPSRRVTISTPDHISKDTHSFNSPTEDVTACVVVVPLPRMSSKTPSANSIAHARRTVQQLRIEASIERIKVSKASADLMNYCGEHVKYDPLVMGIPASENPFKDKKPCTIL
ncbi:unnamed protein product [Gadus morhua 'NCC']